MSEVYIQYHEINWKSLRWSDRFPQTENNFTILLSPNTKHFETWAQKCLEDGMCTKDEEREPLQPDGNNKDVKVITTKITFVKVKVKLYHWKVKVKWYFKKNGWTLNPWFSKKSWTVCKSQCAPIWARFFFFSICQWFLHGFLFLLGYIVKWL